MSATAEVDVRALTVTAAEEDRPRLCETFRTHGAVVVKGLFTAAEMSSFQAAYRGLVQARLRALGKVEAAAETDLDMLYDRLAEADPNARFDMRGIARDHLAFYRYLAHPKVTGVVASLIGHDHLQINPDINLFRIDSPDKDREGFEWHQDYPYNMMSQTAVTTWTPITPLDATMGYLRVVPGSHDKILPVVETPAITKKRYQQHNQLRIDGIDAIAADLEKRAVEVSNIDLGDTLFIHSLILHRSGQNRSNRHRFVMNARFGDIEDPALTARAWRVARVRDMYPFFDVHAELARRNPPSDEC